MKNLVEPENRLYVIVCEGCEKKSKPFITYTYALEYCIPENGWKRDWRRTLCLECYKKLEE